MRPELDKKNIQLITVCPETPEEIAKGRKWFQGDYAVRP
jgi:hypothetical protein